MKLLILESFCYELHVFYWYFMFHLKLDLYLSAFPTVVRPLKPHFLGLILLKLFDLVHGFGDIQKMPKNDYLKIVKKNCSVAQFLSLTPPKSGV